MKNWVLRVVCSSRGVAGVSSGRRGRGVGRGLGRRSLWRRKRGFGDAGASAPPSSAGGGGGQLGSGWIVLGVAFVMAVSAVCGCSGFLGASAAACAVAGAGIWVACWTVSGGAGVSSGAGVGDLVGSLEEDELGVGVGTRVLLLFPPRRIRCG